jgi:hypothetical protein
MKEKYDKTYSPPDEEAGYRDGYHGGNESAATAYRTDQDVFGDEADAQARSRTHQHRIDRSTID